MITINTIGFTTWFTLGCYGGLASCAVAIAANVCYTIFRQRGTTRQLVAIVVVCALAALLLLPAIIWFHLRFSVRQAQLSHMEIYLVLAYIAFCGWLLPIGATCGYILFTRSRAASPPPPLRGSEQQSQQSSPLQQQSVPPRYQPGMPVPFVYGDDTPWGWLEYRTGSFQGQRLALKRAIITIGRDENNEIWLDDDMASRYHAELTWHDGRVYLTDCESLNGVQLNGQRIQHSVLVSSNDLIEVGSHRFGFVLEEEPRKLDESDDPLDHHTWRSALESLTAGSNVLPATRPLDDFQATIGEEQELSDSHLKQTEEVDRAAPLRLPNTMQGALVISGGSKAGQNFRLNRPSLTVGRGIESDVIINDTSISRRHVQFLCLPDGDYVQDLVSRNGTTINGEPLSAPRRLQFGDKVMIGNICLEYTSVHTLQSSSITMDITPPPTMTGPISGVGLAPLRLPSRQKEE